MAAPAIPPIRLGLIGTGPAVEKLHWQTLRRLADRYVVNRVHRPVRRAKQAVRRLQRGRSTRAAADRAVPPARDDADSGALQAANSTMDAPSDLALNLVFTGGAMWPSRGSTGLFDGLPGQRISSSASSAA